MANSIPKNIGQLIDTVLILWSYHIEENPLLFSLLHICLLKITLACRYILCAEQHNEILERNSKIYCSNKLTKMIKLEMMDYLSSISNINSSSKKECLSIISSLFNNLLQEEDLIISERLLISFKQFAQSSNDQLIIDALDNNSKLKENISLLLKSERFISSNNNFDLIFLEEQSTHHHTCIINTSNLISDRTIGPDKKRLKISSEGDTSLEQLRNGAHYLLKVFNEKGLNDNQLKYVTEIKNVLSNIK